MVACAAEAIGDHTRTHQVEDAKLKKIFSVVSAIVAVLGLASTSHAQPPGITREMIATALPVEGAPLAEPGPYKACRSQHSARRAMCVSVPLVSLRSRRRDTLPVMVWGNGGCAINSTRYGGFLTTIASHGFVVLATAAEPGTHGHPGHGR